MTTFDTEHRFGDLSWWSGLFPFRRRSLAPAVSLTGSTSGIRSLVGVGNQRLAPSPLSALPPEDATPVAVPQYISGRTSYLHVRLAFHPYPQVIPQFCNTGEFEPRRPFTAASLCPWIAHVVSGRIIATGRPVQTRFPCGCPSLATVNLSGPLARLGGARRRCTRRIILQKARHQP